MGVFTRLMAAMRRRPQLLAAVGAIVGALALAAAGLGVFRSVPLPGDVSVWRVILADRAALGSLVSGSSPSRSM